MQAVLQDARYAVRLFGRYRAFSVISVLTVRVSMCPREVNDFEKKWAASRMTGAERV